MKFVLHIVGEDGHRHVLAVKDIHEDQITHFKVVASHLNGMSLKKWWKPWAKDDVIAVLESEDSASPNL